ncbi:MAG: D-mannonate epimerase, partial [Acidobacteriaceae bacterium]
MSLYLAHGDAETDLPPAEMKSLLFDALDQLGARKRVLIVPPDITRLHSRAGDLTRYAWQYYGDRMKAVLPALGTHAAMSAAQLTAMFGDVPQDRFHIHNWRTDIET